MEQKASAHNSHKRSTMEATSCSLWQCSTCTYAKNNWAAVECEVCGTIVHAKCPASPIPASDAVASIRKEQILVEDYLLGKGRMRDHHFVNLHTTINCKSAWTMEGSRGGRAAGAERAGEMPCHRLGRRIKSTKTKRERFGAMAIVGCH